MRRAQVIAAGLALAMYWTAGAQSGPPPLAVSATYRCLWWSEAQMENFDPNSPPPKKTEVVIKKWEYSDPVGVPHPDVVDLVVEIKNGATSPASQVLVEISGQWRVGPLTAERKASWGPRMPLKTWKVDEIAPGQTASARIPIDLASRMSELRAKRAWPWTFRASLIVRSEGSEKAPISREFSLPIQPGD